MISHIGTLIDIALCLPFTDLNVSFDPLAGWQASSVFPLLSLSRVFRVAPSRAARSHEYAPPAAVQCFAAGVCLAASVLSLDSAPAPVNVVISFIFS